MIKKGILFFLLLSITLFETQAFAHFSEVNSKRSHLSNGNNRKNYCNSEIQN